MGKFIVSRVAIQAPAEKVWDLLTQPEQTKKYMYGCETISDWQPGSPLQWRMMHEGQELIVVKGHVEDIRPAEKLVYTVFDPHSGIEDIPENYLRVVYDLSREGDTTVLTVTQGDYNTVAEGERRYEAANNNGEGWTPILVQIKALAEAS